MRHNYNIRQKLTLKLLALAIHNLQLVVKIIFKNIFGNSELKLLFN